MYLNLSKHRVLLVKLPILHGAPNNSVNVLCQTYLKRDTNGCRQYGEWWTFLYFTAKRVVDVNRGCK